ncbi:MAG TPA: enoyl-CoA hydratase-related protein, partial [Phenylobacterium sp.]|uniref:enoyl-CoA hydratase-related protein n=1 Tax=Phenylobacterium sp. TaxID=1871053 RepID=UPI002F92445B
MSEHILIEKAGGVLTLTMNRPDKKNALTREMYQTLGDAIDQAEFDKDVRCILIQGNGDMFTAGNDLSDFAAVNAGDRAAGEARRGG